MSVVRRLFQIVAGIGATGFGCLIYVYLTLPDVRPLIRSNPTTTAFIRIRADEARAKGHVPRRVQRWVGYTHVSSDLKRAVLVAEDDAFFEHEGVDLAAAVRLAMVSGVGPRMWQNLLGRFGSPQAVLAEPDRQDGQGLNTSGEPETGTLAILEQSFYRVRYALGQSAAR